MPHSDGNGESLANTQEEKFLSDEYKALIDLDKARNERLDRFLTIFMALAAAPWALYALILKDHSAAPSLSALPPLIAAAFVLTGVLGALVSMMYIQVWFTIVLYMRAVNAIRGYFLETDTRLSFRLPMKPDGPPYYGKGSYLQFAVAGMALANSIYIGLGLFNWVNWPCSLAIRVFVAVLVVGICWSGHLIYFSRQGRKRESHSQGELRWRK